MKIILGALDTLQSPLWMKMEEMQTGYEYCTSQYDKRTCITNLSIVLDGLKRVLYEPYQFLSNRNTIQSTRSHSTLEYFNFSICIPHRAFFSIFGQDSFNAEKFDEFSSRAIVELVWICLYTKVLDVRI